MGLLRSASEGGGGGDGVAAVCGGGVLDPPACRARMDVANDGADILRPWSF